MNSPSPPPSTCPLVASVRQAQGVVQRTQSLTPLPATQYGAAIPAATDALATFGVVGDLLVCFGRWDADAHQLHLITHSDLQQSQLTPERALEAATLNAMRIQGVPVLETYPTDSAGVRLWRLRCNKADGELVTSLLFSSSIWKGWRNKIGGDALVAIPRRGMVLVAPADDAPSVEALRQTALQRYPAQAPGLRVSDHLLRLSAQGWQPVQPLVQTDAPPAAAAPAQTASAANAQAQAQARTQAAPPTPQPPASPPPSTPMPKAAAAGAQGMQDAGSGTDRQTASGHAASHADSHADTPAARKTPAARSSKAAAPALDPDHVELHLPLAEQGVRQAVWCMAAGSLLQLAAHGIPLLVENIPALSELLASPALHGFITGSALSWLFTALALLLVAANLHAVLNMARGLGDDKHSKLNHMALVSLPLVNIAVLGWLAWGTARYLQELRYPVEWRTPPWK